MILYRRKQTTHTTQMEENKMILSGKDLFNYRVNQIKTVAAMVGGVVGTISFMMFMFANFC